MKTIQYIVTKQDDSTRLDAALARLIPDMGLRGRRRMCKEGKVAVNGVPRPEAWKLRTGDTISLDQHPLVTPDMQDGETMPLASSVCIIHQENGLAAVYKPPGLHSAALAGSDNASLESMLATLFPNVSHPWPIMLNRLDCPTSGLVMVALSPEGDAVWSHAHGLSVDPVTTRIQKRYIMLLEGRLDEETLAAKALDLGSSSLVKGTQFTESDPRRHTLFEPLAHFSAQEISALMKMEVGLSPLSPVTLAGGAIVLGHRHQIRAHAASLGHPLLGDIRHGGHAFRPGKKRPETDFCRGEAIFLHHGGISIPDFQTWCPAPWLADLPDSIAQQASRWLSTLSELAPEPE